MCIKKRQKNLEKFERNRIFENKKTEEGMDLLEEIRNTDKCYSRNDFCRSKNLTGIESE